MVEMKIAVLMKQVAGCDARSSETGGALRSAETISLNPSDIYALETALARKRENGAEVSVFTMGPAHASNLLIEACRLGADFLYLISDPLYGGADTFVTAKVLKRALDRQGPFDLVLAGERAIDGETGQVPGELAAMMDVPFATGVVEMDFTKENTLTCRCLTEDASEIVEAGMPCVLGISCGMQGIEHPIIPGLRDLARARNAQITILDNSVLGFAPGEVGLAGSPTRVNGVRKVSWTRESRRITGADEAVAETLRALFGSRGAS